MQRRRRAEGSLSLLETTDSAVSSPATSVELGSVADDAPGDVPIYLSDCSRARSRYATGARGATPRETLADTSAWIRDTNRPVLETI